MDRSVFGAGVRLVFVACVSLSACAAGPGGGHVAPGYGAFLAARYAVGQGDAVAATNYYGVALGSGARAPSLASEAFLAAIMADSPQAAVLAGQVPGNPLAMLVQGNAAAQAGRFDEAAQDFGALPADNLSGLIKPILLAWAQFGAGDARGAVSSLSPNFGNGPFGAVDALNAALIADAGHDDADAAALYGTLGADAPDLRLAQMLASWQARQGHLPQAFAILDAMVAAHPGLRLALPALRAHVAQRVVSTPVDGLAEAYLTLAGSLDQPSQRFLQQIFLHFALSLQPDLSAARLVLAGAQTADAKPPPQALAKALDILRPIPADDPLYAPAASQQADLLAQLDRPAEAEALLQKLVATDPGDPDVLASLGDAQRAESHWADAAGTYGKAIAAAGSPAPPGAWTLYFDRGICEDSLGQWPAAERDILAARALAPNQPYVLNYLGYSWALRGENLAAARDMLQQAVGMDPKDGAVIDSLGFVYMKQGQVKKAVTLLTKAVELDPDDAEVNAHLGDAFFAAGQKLQADYQWQRALALKPDDKLRADIAAKLQKNFSGPPA
jgi:Flp pilus assembly protein TadD